MTTRVFPRNLTARSAIQIAGNPVTTRLESGVGNCFPGLEFDHRNLDRRFFPGLVINFGITTAGLGRRGLPGSGLEGDHTGRGRCFVRGRHGRDT